MAENAPVVHAIHENPEWFGVFADAFAAEGVPYREWLLTGGVLDLGEQPPAGVYWSRFSASSHTRGHTASKEHTRAVLAWAEAAGRRVVNGRRVLELEVSKIAQLTALRAAGIAVPMTRAVVGTANLLAAAADFPGPGWQGSWRATVLRHRGTCPHRDRGQLSRTGRRRKPAAGVRTAR